jgi:hypothetical protein
MAGIQFGPGFLLCQTSISDYGSSYAAVGLLQVFTGNFAVSFIRRPGKNVRDKYGILSACTLFVRNV